MQKLRRNDGISILTAGPGNVKRSAWVRAALAGVDASGVAS